MLLTLLVLGQYPGLFCFDESAALGYARGLRCMGGGIACSMTGQVLTMTVSGGGPGGGAPTDAKYITQTCHADLESEQCMGALESGLVLNTTTTGVQSIYAGATCSNQFVRSLNRAGTATCASVSLATDVTGSLPGAAVSGAVATATALAANPTDCGGGQYATAIDASGNLTCATPAGGSDPWTYLAVNGGADFTTSSATAVDVTGLGFAPSANTKYEVECLLMLRTATATVNPRAGFAWATGLTDGVVVLQESQAATGTPLYAGGNINAASLVAVGGLPNTTQSWPAKVDATFVAGASPSGSVRVQMASETAGTVVTVKSVGSFCRWRTRP